jgi:SAM-dependent methyltransferase
VTFERAKEAFAHDPNADTYLAEAEFGYQQMVTEIRMLPAGAQVLEVGSGGGVLLLRMALEFPHLSFEGIEPMSGGFGYVTAVHELVNELENASLQPSGYEDLPREPRHDLIFSVNVFEHLPDWSHFLDFASEALLPGGACLILCPNYSFPYEPHFRFPVVVGKRISGWVWRRRIRRFEEENDCPGLWQSLNFVTCRAVKRKAGALGLAFEYRTRIITEMIERLDSDSEFASRQGMLRGPVRLMQRLGILPRLLSSPLLENYLPYMDLRLTRPM